MTKTITTRMDNVMSLQQIPAGILAVLKEVKLQEETAVDSLNMAFKNNCDSRELLALHHDVSKLRKTKHELLKKLKEIKLGSGS